MHLASVSSRSSLDCPKLLSSLKVLSAELNYRLLCIDVHPFDVCQKLGWKYASVPFCELNKQQDFYRDLLRYSFIARIPMPLELNT